MPPHERLLALGSVPPNKLQDARLQLHYAAQVLAATCDTALPHRDDDSHTALGWSDAHHALVTETLPGQLRLGLALSDLIILVIGADDQMTHKIPLNSLAMGDAIQQLKTILEPSSPSHYANGITPRDYDMPPHNIANGAAFSYQHPEPFQEVALYFELAYHSLAGVTKHMPGAGPIRVWPHHFDMASLVILEGDPTAGKSVGLGFSPGDANIAQPYFYVLPWPVEKGASLPEAGKRFHWEQKHFVGLVMEADEVLKLPAKHRVITLIDLLAESFVSARKLVTSP